jgi:putative sigma-54 modulation protein
MNIAITFRHLDPSDAVKQYAHDKVAKLQKFLRQPMTANVTVDLIKLEHLVELRVSSGDAHFQAREQSTDMYASIDKVVDKVERQIADAKRAAGHKHGPGAGEFAASIVESEE